MSAAGDTALTRRQALDALLSAQPATRANPRLLLSADPYFELAGEEFGARLLITAGRDGTDHCLRPDFTLPIAADYIARGTREPAGYSYLGPIFRQRATGPAEFDQAGIEFLAPADGEEALERVLFFARAALALYGIEQPRIFIGGVGLFEALLEALDMPAPWRPRIRHRFGHAEALARLFERLAAPPAPSEPDEPDRESLVEEVTARMVSAGLSLTDGRRPEEIAGRFLEERALEAARPSSAVLAVLTEYLAIEGPAAEALERVAALGIREALDLSAPLAALVRHVEALDGTDLRFSASFSPRLDYYTGLVFEMRGRNGAILASGGQYDRLLERLGARAPIAASGCALWVDRLEAEVIP